jgi:hypothetical protein
MKTKDCPVKIQRRTLLNNDKVKVIKNKVSAVIDTTCPKKWRFVDLETGEVWMFAGLVNGCLKNQRGFKFDFDSRFSGVKCKGGAMIFEFKEHKKSRKLFHIKER